MARVAIPQSPDELARMLEDPAVLKDIWGDKENRDEFLKSYVTNYLGKDAAYQQQLKEQVQNGLAEFLRDNGVKGGGRTPVPLGGDGGSAIGASRRVSRGKGAVYNKTAPGAKLDAAGLDNPFESMAEFIQACWPKHNTLRNRDDLRKKMALLEPVMNSFGSEVPADGGFLVPEVLRSELLAWSLENSVVRPRATVLPMSSLRLPIPTIDSTSNVSSVFGGITVYWTEEGGALTESTASFGRAVLEARKLTAYAEMPNELLADAVAFGAFFDQKFPQAISFFEDVAFLTGSGSGEPLGVLNGGGKVTVSGESGQTTSTIVFQNVLNMYSRMLPTALNNAVWVCSPDTLPQLFSMSLSVGTGGSTVMIGNHPGQTAADAPRMSLLGHPLIVSEKVPPLGTAGCLSFINFDFYLIGDRQTMQVNSSEHYKFANDKTAFRVIQRVDGQPWLRTAITPQNNSSNTLSPYVVLAGI